LTAATALAAWCVPGGGYFILGEKKRAAIIFAAVTATFCLGLYVGSIGVIDPVAAKPWYVAQMLNSPLVAVIGRVTAAGSFAVYGKPNEIGQIYTSISGLLNCLCIVRSAHLAHDRNRRTGGGRA
jgi:hypothetical protein